LSVNKKQGVTTLKVLCGQHGVIGLLRLLIIVVISFSAAPAAIAAKQIIADENQKIIVVDPGHGGYDTGAKGIGGALEKNVTLKIARRLAKELDHKYRTVLTRTDDYELDLKSRTAVANHLKADLFISIHSGGSFLHNADGIVIFYFKGSEDQPFSRERIDAGVANVWHALQVKHTKASDALARLIKKSLCIQKHVPEVIVKNGDLVILGGADMPAVLIETGYLSNPAEEKRLNEREYLQSLVKCISTGVDCFFSGTPDRK
jgi:N-acetylmuramoyl-L-alanine amidase